MFPNSPSAYFLLNLIEDRSGARKTSYKDMGFLNKDSRILRDALSPDVMEFLGYKLGGIEFDTKILETFFDEFKKKMKSQKEESVDLLSLSRTILFEKPAEDLEKVLKLESERELADVKKGYEEILNIAPYLTHAYYLYGLFLELNGFEEEALGIYESSIKHDFKYLEVPQSPELSNLFTGRPNLSCLKEIHIPTLLKEFHEKTKKEGAGSLHRYIRYKLAQAAEGKIKYGFEKETSGETTEALNAYEDAVNIDPTNPIAHYVLGLAYETRGLEKEAMASYEKTRGADFSGIESSEEISRIIEDYLGKTTKDGHRVGAILGRYFEIIAEDPDHMLELLGFIEDLKIESISRIIKSYVSTDMILGAEGKVVRDQQDFGEAGGRGTGKVVRDRLDYGEDLDKEKEKIEKAKSMSKTQFKLLWKYKTQRSIRCEASTGDCNLILAGSENGIIYLIDRNANSPWRHDTGASVVDIDISGDGKHGVFCNSSNKVELLDCASGGKPLWRKQMGKTRINGVTISSFNGRIAVATNNFELSIFDIKGDRKTTFKTDELIKLLDSTDVDETIVAASEKNIYIIEGRGEPRVLKSFGHNETLQSIALSRNGEYIAVGTKEGEMYLLKRNGDVLWRRDILNPVYGVSVSSEGNAVSGGMNGTIVLFSREGEPVWKYQTGENIWDVDISDKGGKIVTGCGLVFGNVYLFSVKTDA